MPAGRPDFRRYSTIKWASRVHAEAEERRRQNRNAHTVGVQPSQAQALSLSDPRSFKTGGNASPSVLGDDLHTEMLNTELQSGISNQSPQEPMKTAAELHSSLSSSVDVEMTDSPAVSFNSERVLITDHLNNATSPAHSGTLPRANADEFSPPPVRSEPIEKTDGLSREGYSNPRDAISVKHSAVTMSTAEGLSTRAERDESSIVDDDVWQELPDRENQEYSWYNDNDESEEVSGKSAEPDVSDAGSDHDPIFSSFFPIFLQICSTLGILIVREPRMDDPSNLLKPFDDALAELKQILFKDMCNSLRRRVFLYQREIREGKVLGGTLTSSKPPLSISEKTRKKEGWRMRRDVRDEQVHRDLARLRKRREEMKSRNSPLAKQCLSEFVAPNGAQDLSSAPRDVSKKSLSSLEHIPGWYAGSNGADDGSEKWSITNIASKAEDYAEATSRSFRDPDSRATQIIPKKRKVSLDQDDLARETLEASRKSEDSVPPAYKTAQSSGNTQNPSPDDESPVVVSHAQSQAFGLQQVRFENDAYDEGTTSSFGLIDNSPAIESESTFDASIFEERKVQDEGIFNEIAESQLLEMGFDSTRIDQALSMTTCDFESALAILLAGGDEQHSDTENMSLSGSDDDNLRDDSKQQISATQDAGRKQTSHGRVSKRERNEPQRQILAIRDLSRFGFHTHVAQDQQHVLNLTRVIDIVIAEIGRLWQSYMTIGLCAGVYVRRVRPLQYDVDGLCRRLEVFATNHRMRKVVCCAKARFDAVWDNEWETALDHQTSVKKIRWMPFIAKSNVRRAVLEAALAGMRYRGVVDHGMLGG